jgi:hypothetical protein
MGRKRTRDQAAQQHAAQEQAAQQHVLRFKVVRDTRGGFRITFQSEGVVWAIASPNAWDVFAAVAAMLNPEWTTIELFRHFEVTL